MTLAKPPSRGRGEKGLILGVKRPIRSEIDCFDAGLRLSAAFRRQRAWGREATQEPKNSSGGPGSPSRTRMRSSSSGSSGAFLSRLQTFSVRFGATFVFPIRRLCRFLFPFSCLITALSMKDKQNGSIRIAAVYLLSIMAKIR